MPNPPLSQRALSLIISEEGLDQPYIQQPKPSGVTLGRGHDLRFDSVEAMREAWGQYLTEDQLKRLSLACGRVASPDLCAKYRDIHITKEQADEVFSRVDAPRYIAQTCAAFPGADLLPADAFGALVSLVYNRGSRMSDIDPEKEDRREMRAIRDAVAKGDLLEIAWQLRSMQRLWPAIPDLVRRRENEASLVEFAYQSTLIPQQSNEVLTA